MAAGAATAAEAPSPLAIRSGKVPGNEHWQYFDLEPDLAKVRLSVAIKQGGGPLDVMIPPGALAAINGGYFDRAYQPTGWLVSEGKEIHRQNRASLGGVVAIRGSRVYVGPTANLTFKKPDFAVQNTPLLLDAKGAVAIKKENGRRAARTVACLAEGSLHLIVIQAGPAAGPTLLETAELLARPKKDGGFGCQGAVNLDGGSSTGIWLPPSAGTPSMLPIVPIGYGIAFVPR